MENVKALITRALDLILLALLSLSLACSVFTYKNAIAWLNDAPASLSTDTSYTGNPTLRKYLDDEYELVFVRPTGNFSSYKKKLRIGYLKNGESATEQEQRWEMFLNDENTYKYEGKNDFWTYIREYYLFLNSLGDENKSVVQRGFEDLKAHVKDVGVLVDSGSECISVGSTMLMLRFEEDDWKTKLWAELVGEYIEVALTDIDVDWTARLCWLGSVPDYLRREIGVGGEEHLKILAEALFGAAHSFEVQHSGASVIFYEDVPEYIVDFYEKLFGAGSGEEFYGYLENVMVGDDGV